MPEALAHGVESIPGIPVPVDPIRPSVFGKQPNTPALDSTAEHLQALATAVATEIRG